MPRNRANVPHWSGRIQMPPSAANGRVSVDRINPEKNRLLSSPPVPT